jgi:chemotaxis signal transduction protein
MEKYKLDEFINYMSYVDKYEKQLTNLNDAWEQIKILGEITCPNQAKTILPSMTITQKGFQELKEKLIENLAMESVKKISLEMASKAQFVVDIVIRNLFERTADVGFLATDDDIRKYLKNQNPSSEEKEFMIDRLTEYVKKYTVYEEIAVLDKEMNVKVHLDVNNPIDDIKIQDQEFEDTLIESKDYVETFGKSQIQPQKKQSLIYTCKIHASNEPGDSIIGYLCLCFRFENEMEGIFKRLKKSNDPSVMLILDNEGKVIGSSDEVHVPISTKIEMNLEDEVRIIYFRGVEYLGRTTKTKGYQGYYGLGWHGHVMMPLASSFKQSGTSTMDRIDKNVLQGVMDQSNSFSSGLFEIAQRASSINMSLRRVVWNGQVMSEDNDEKAQSEYVSLKSLLGQISKIGLKTSNLFKESIRNLYETVISSTLSDVQFIASLATDIMDRNLYERSNDCRWWALTSDFRRILSKDVIADKDRESISEILEYINSLYTVYTNLFVYDRNGEIIAVSNSSANELVGHKIDQEWVKQTLSLRHSQQYSVSKFEKTSLYEGKPTYIYGAAITDIEHHMNVVGGIGIVFDAEPQFHSMLEDSLPRRDGSFALFLDRKGTVIASTNENYKEGDKFPISSEFLTKPNGSGMSNIVIHDNVYYAVGGMTSSGYREYKNTNDYNNDVIALTFVKFGEVDTKTNRKNEKKLIPVEKMRKISGEKSVEIATFVIHQKRYGIYADAILEAISYEGIAEMPGAKGYIEGSVVFHGSVIQVIDLRHVFDLKSKEENELNQIIVVNGKKGKFGFLVDDLDDVIEVPENMLEEVSGYIAEDCGYVHKIVDLETSEGHSLMLIIDPDKVLEFAIDKDRHAVLA